MPLEPKRATCRHDDFPAESCTTVPATQELTGVEFGPNRVRTFPGGATRDLTDGKPDYEGYLSPDVIEAFGAYMLKHQETAAGRRTSDNWQNGMPREEVMKSAFRHFVEAWKLHRAYLEERRAGRPSMPITMTEKLLEALMALLFNVQVYAHEMLEGRDVGFDVKEKLQVSHQCDPDSYCRRVSGSAA
jgi:hypothetical protein